jgi:EAL domain-containing protein (putative c-di-GMP-specific phosphodiesterase class I)
MNAQYVIYSRQVSKEHTEIYRLGKEFRIRDLGSTNGTFVNGVRINEALLANGDIIHVAHKELRFGYEAGEQDEEPSHSFTEPAVSQLPASVIRGSKHLREMLSDHSVRIVFQPIVTLDGGRVVAYEALGRGTHSQLSSNPTELFGLANQCNLAGELSQMLRMVAGEEAAGLPDAVRIFINLHSSEINNKALVDSLRELKRIFRKSQQVVLEVHENLVADLATMHWLRQQLKSLEMGLAYDDFGAGQARLAELAEVPPDFIKLDRSLIRNIDSSTGRQELLQALNRVIQDLGVQSIAEGIETLEEARTCKELGCKLGQGYLFGRPQPLALLTTDWQEEALARFGVV